jgi:hypothetical protein
MQENPNFWQRLAALDPAVLRATIVAVVGIVGAIVGHTLGNETVDLIVNVALGLLAIVAGLVIRPAVTPNAKVLAFKPNPVDAPNRIESGEAVATPDQINDVVEAAVNLPNAA